MFARRAGVDPCITNIATLVNWIEDTRVSAHSSLRTAASAVFGFWESLGQPRARDDPLFLAYSAGFRRLAPAVRHKVDVDVSLREVLLRLRPVLPTCSPRDRALVLLMIDGFFRSSDLARALPPTRVSAESALLRIAGPKERALMGAPSALSNPVVIAASEPRDLCSLRALAAWLTARQPSSRLFCQEDGSPLTPDAVRNAVARVLATAGLPISVHALRGLSASAAADVGVPLDLLRAHARWSNIRTHLQHYRCPVVVRRERPLPAAASHGQWTSAHIAPALRSVLPSAVVQLHEER